jgi:hypothetical protein
MTAEEFVKRDLKDQCIAKMLALNRRGEASNLYARTLIFGFLLFHPSPLVLFSLFSPLFLCISFFVFFPLFSVGLLLPLYLFPLIFRLSLAHAGFISSLPQLASERLCCCCTVENVRSDLLNLVQSCGLSKWSSPCG